MTFYGLTTSNFLVAALVGLILSGCVVFLTFDDQKGDIKTHTVDIDQSKTVISPSSVLWLNIISWVLIVIGLCLFVFGFIAIYWEGR